MDLTKNDNLIKLIKVLNDDPEKAEKFYNMGSSEELYKYCISLVPGYDFDEFVEFMKNVAKISEKNNLSDSELSKVSGGRLDFLETFILTKTFIQSVFSSKQQTEALIDALTEDDENKKKNENKTN